MDLVFRKKCAVVLIRICEKKSFRKINLAKVFYKS